VAHDAPLLTSLQALSALLAEGFQYLDVRTAAEFELGRVPGAINVPWQLGTLAGLVPNPEFETLLRERLPLGQRCVVGCRSGQRARAAAKVVARLGYDCRVDALGFDGARDAFGRFTPGWSHSGLSVERGPR
jgi:rhodanese-related sulfurtransferase